MRTAPPTIVFMKDGSAYFGCIFWAESECRESLVLFSDVTSYNGIRLMYWYD